MWKYVSCEVQGRGHIKSNTPCQDKVLSFSRNGVVLILLADGAGSARLSHFGAECIVQSMPAILKDAMERAYKEAGWDLETSKNKYADNLFPNFSDVLIQIEKVVNTY